MLLNFFPLSLTTRPNQLECLSLETLSSQVLEFEDKSRANPITPRTLRVRACFMLSKVCTPSSWTNFSTLPALFTGQSREWELKLVHGQREREKEGENDSACVLYACKGHGQTREYFSQTLPHGQTLADDIPGSPSVPVRERERGWEREREREGERDAERVSEKERERKRKRIFIF
jgi:hypothetical protein